MWCTPTSLIAGARTSADAPDRSVVPVQAPYAHQPPGWLARQVVPDRNTARGDRPRHNRSMPGDGERSVDRHPE